MKKFTQNLLIKQQYKIGDICHVRAANIDEVYYEAIILDNTDNIYKVQYLDDNTIESNIKYNSIIYGRRKILYNINGIKVEDGYMMFNNITRYARFLVMEQANVPSPGVTQSASLLSSSSSSSSPTKITPELPLDIHQAIALSIPIYLNTLSSPPFISSISSIQSTLGGGGTPHTQPQNIKTCIIGCGGGSLLTAFTHLYPTILEKPIDVVDISPTIIEAARLHFNLLELEQTNDIKIHITDGYKFLLNNETTKYDIIIIDVAGNDAIDGQLPPDIFLDIETFLNHLPLNPNGMIVLNMYAPYTRVIQFCQDVVNTEIFQTQMVLSTNPNFIFYLRKKSPITTLEVDNDNIITPTNIQKWIQPYPVELFQMVHDILFNNESPIWGLFHVKDLLKELQIRY